MKAQCKKRQAWLCSRSIFCIGAALIVCALPASAQSQGSEWILEQSNVDMGKLSLYISRDAVKIISGQWGYHLLARAPDWRVHCFRPEAKIEWIGDLNAFSGDMLENPMAIAVKNTTAFSAFESGLLKGLKYTRYAPQRQSPSAVYGANDIAVSARASEFVARYYTLPDTGKIPIYCRVDKGQPRPIPHAKNEWLKVELGRDLRSGVTVELVTTSWQKIPFKASDFSPPQGYKIMGGAAAVGYSNKQKESMNDFINEAGFASDRGSTGQNVPGKNSAPPPWSR